MTTRRGGRQPQVRPRPPSGSRTAPTRVRPRAPERSRISPHRKVRSSRGLPWPARLVLAVAVVALGAAVLYSATGGIGKIVAAVGSVVGDFVDEVTATPEPVPTDRVVATAPTIARPDEPYTNQPEIDLVVTVPEGAIRRTDARVRLYLTLEGQTPAPLHELPIGTTTRVVFAQVGLTEGLNGFSATIMDGAGESAPSATVDYVLDISPPAIAIASPENGATVNRDVIRISGSTQPRTTLAIRNEANGASTTAIAGPDGAFEATVTIQQGTNGIRIAATDPAGNEGEIVLAIRRGTGQLAADLTASSYRLRRDDLPVELELAVRVIDPDGRPLEGAAVTFTLQIPGIQAIVSNGTSGGDGTARFATTIPKGAGTGGGLAAVLVNAGDLGQTSDRATITIE